jgi:hypothetical protein
VVEAEPTGRRSRSAVAGPVAVAAIFLAIIGASVGFVLGTRGDDNGGAASPNSGVETPTQTSPPDDGETEEPQQVGGGEPPAPPDAAETTTGDRCPRHTVRLARDAGAAGGLERKLYIRTNKSEAWICVDTAGRYFYQGRSGQPWNRFVEGQNALFLTEVWADGDGYRATNADTTYHISTAELVIEDGSGRRVQPVVEHRP